MSALAEPVEIGDRDTADAHAGNAAAAIAHHEQQIELIDRGEWKDPGSEQTASRQLVSPGQ